MTSGGPKYTSRRQFVVTAAGIAGGAVSGITIAGGKLCPPSVFGVRGGASTSTSCGALAAGLPQLVLTSAAPSGTYAWTFGHAFRLGDVPSGQYITTSGGTAQAQVRNRWSDGSAKYAVLSGITPFRQNVPTPVVLSTASSGPAGATVPEPKNLNVVATFTGGVTGTYSLASCLGSDLSKWNKGQPGRVREFLGPVMSEFHYYRPTMDAHVALWFFVRCYSNGATEVETVVENGWMGVPAPGERDYTLSLVIGANTVFSGSVSHYSHTRWSRVDWIGTNPSITPSHNPAYLRATRMVPNYGFTSPSAAAFTGLASDLNPIPFALGNWTAVMGNAGYQPSIGILPLWEALYCTTSDSRAYAATISNNRGSGRWPIHYRDENTGRVCNYLSYPNTTLTSGWGIAPPAPSGGTNGAWNVPHHPSNGYLAYLIEGRWSQIESLQFAAIAALLESNPPTRQGGGVLACLNAPLTTRGAAWAWRTVGQAAAVTPTTFDGVAPAPPDAALRAAFVQSVQDTAKWNNERYVLGTTYGGAFRNSIGWLGQYDGYTGPNIPQTEFWGGSWMVAFQGMALGHIADLGIEGLANQADLEATRNFVYQDTLLTIGTNATWNFRRAGTYERPYLKNSSRPDAPVFMTINEAFSSYVSNNGLSPNITANSSDPLLQHDSDLPTSGGDTSNPGFGYWALHISVLAQAVDAGVSGASAAYALVQAAPNCTQEADGASNTPQFAFVPRT